MTSSWEIPTAHSKMGRRSSSWLLPSVFFGAIADFNVEDGKVKLLNEGKLQFVKPIVCGTSLWLGNGDGTFQTGKAIPDASMASASVAADVNGDGNLDLIGSSSDQTQLVVLLGNGDGTFQPALTFAAGTNPFDQALLPISTETRLQIWLPVNSGAAIVACYSTQGTDFFNLGLHP